MIIIDDVLISDDIVKKHFVCNLSACKGACCWEGDYGAPLKEKEAKQLEENIEVIKKHLPIESRNYLKRAKAWKLYKGPNLLGTPLLRNKRCVYLTTDDKGISICAIEKAYHEGDLAFNKPISCHLYPIRVKENKEQKFEAWNYDVWDICSAACKLGKKNGVRIYEFLKAAIVRYKGQDFYDQLDAAANRDE